MRISDWSSDVCSSDLRGTPGFEIRKGYNSVSHRGYHNCILSFDNCRLPASQILGEPHRGFELANDWLYATRLTVAAMAVGRARRALDYAVSYAAERKQVGQQIGSLDRKDVVEGKSVAGRVGIGGRRN